MMNKIYDIRERTLKYSIELLKFLSTLNYPYHYQPVITQLVKSGTSVGANVHESKSSSSHRDYIKFLTIALKSANETKYWLKLINGILELNKNNYRMLMDEIDEISKIIAQIIIKIKNNNK